MSSINSSIDGLQSTSNPDDCWTSVTVCALPLIRRHERFCLMVNTSHPFTTLLIKCHESRLFSYHLLRLSLHHCYCDQHQAQSITASQHRDISGKSNTSAGSLSSRAWLSIPASSLAATVDTNIFAVLICVLMFVGSVLAGPLSSIKHRFATHLFNCMLNMEACHDRCLAPGTCQMLTRGGWVFSPAATNTTCVRKCKTVAVAECAGVPYAVLKLP